MFNFVIEQKYSKVNKTRQKQKKQNTKKCKKPTAVRKKS